MLKKSEIGPGKTFSLNLLLHAGRICRRGNRGLFAHRGVFARKSGGSQQLSNALPALNAFLPFPMKPGFVTIDSRHPIFSVIKVPSLYLLATKERKT